MQHYKCKNDDMLVFKKSTSMGVARYGFIQPSSKSVLVTSENAKSGDFWWPSGTTIGVAVVVTVAEELGSF